MSRAEPQTGRDVTTRVGFWSRARPLLLIVSLCVAAFAPVLTADWVQWDDDRNFTEHWAWRGLSLDHLAWMFTTFHMGHYQPLSWLSLGIDWTVFGLDARGFHATNLALHVFTAVAFWFLARRVLALATASTVEPRAVEIGATCAAAFFAVHPLRVESVAWITERRDVLGGLFFVLAVGAWVRHATSLSTHRRLWYAATFVFALLSLLSKASAIVLPAVFVVLDVWPLRRAKLASARWILDKLPFLALSCLFGFLALRAQLAADAALADIGRHGIVERGVQSAYSLAFYLGKTVWPTDLVPIRELPASLFEARFLVPAMSAVVLTAILFAFRRRHPAFLAAWIAYAVILSPTSGVAQAGPQLVADRYSYFSTLPFALLVGGFVMWIARRNRLGARVATAVLSIGLAVLTNSQSEAWRNTRTLWEHTLGVDPDSSVARHNLGSWILVHGASEVDPVRRTAQLMEARDHFEHGLIVTQRPQFDIGLGLVAGQLADLDPAHATELRREALERIERGVRAGEALGRVETAWRFQLGAALLGVGRNADARRELAIVVRAWPDNPQGHRVLALACAAEHDWTDAAHHVELALRVQETDALLWLRLGTFRARAGQVDEARVALERALDLTRVNPAFPGVAELASGELKALPKKRSP